MISLLEVCKANISGLFFIDKYGNGGSCGVGPGCCSQPIFPETPSYFDIGNGNFDCLRKSNFRK